MVDQRRRLHRGRRGRSRAGAGARRSTPTGAAQRGRGRRASRRAADPRLHRLRVRRGGRAGPIARTIGRARSGSYGRTKLAGEREVIAHLRAATALILRTSWLYSATGPQLRAHHAAAHARAGRGRRGQRPGRHAHLGPRPGGGDLGGRGRAASCAASITGPTRASRAGTTSPWRSRRRRWRSGCFARASADPAAPHGRVSDRARDGPPTACSTRPRRWRRSAAAAAPLAGTVCAAHAAGAGACVACSSPAAPASSAPTSSSYWLARHPGDRVVVLDALTYAGQSRRASSRCGATQASRFVHGDIRDAGLVEALLREHEITRWCTSRPSRTSIARSPGRTPSSRPTWSAPTRCSRRPARSGSRRLGEDSASTTSPPTRCTARSVPTIRRSRETTPYAPELALRREQGRLGSPGARVPPHLRAAGHHQQLLQQLRSLPVPREADPAHAGERAGGQAAARSTATA